MHIRIHLKKNSTRASCERYCTQAGF